MSSKEETSSGIIFLIIFATILTTFQVISQILNNDLLAPFPILNFFITPICFGIAFGIFYFLYKSSYFIEITGLVDKLKNWLKMYPFAYKILKFIFRYPLLSGLLLGIIGAVLDYIFFN